MTRNLQLCLLAAALLAAVGCAATSSTQNGTGVLAVAPRFVDLGADWTEREIAFAVDPLDQPPETVNEAASRDHTNRRALLAQLKAGMERESAVGMGYFSYGFGVRAHGEERCDLYLSRFPDDRSLKQQWNKWSQEAALSDQSGGPEIGDEAIWLPRSAADHDHRLVVRKGRYLARLEYAAAEDRERLVELARIVARRATGVTADRQVRPAKDGGAALPRRRDFGRVTSAAMFAALRGLGADEVNQPPAHHAESECGAPPCALAQRSVWMSPIGIPAGGGVLICR